MFKVNNKNTRMAPGVVLVSLLTLNIFYILFQCLYYISTLLQSTSASRYLDTLHYLFGYYLTDAVSECRTIFQCYLLIIFVCPLCCCICSCSPIVTVPLKSIWPSLSHSNRDLPSASMYKIQFVYLFYIFHSKHHLLHSTLVPNFDG